MPTPQNVNTSDCQTGNDVPYPGLRRIEVLGWLRGAVNGTLRVGDSAVTLNPEQVGAWVVRAAAVLCAQSGSVFPIIYTFFQYVCLCASLR